MSTAESHTSLQEESQKHGFIRCNSLERRQKFFASVSGNPWWRSENPNTPTPAWTTVFSDSEWRCVYCQVDLTVSTDIIASSTKEHLVPRALLEASRENPNTSQNMAACCPHCNGLKSDYLPPVGNAWKSRDDYISTCREFIYKRRLDNLEEYLPALVKILEKKAGYCAGTFCASLTKTP